jgi:outer membrane lipoprotein-sorting protein
MYFHLRKTTFSSLSALLPAAVLAVVFLATSGCGFRSSHPVKMRTSTATLKGATLDELVQSINSNAEKLETLKATVDIDSSVLQVKKDKVTDYPQVAGLILVRKPEMLRMRIYFPVLHNVMADMVSNGKTFELASPIKSKFYVGSNQQPVKPSPQPLENLRPQHISDALLLKPIDPDREIAVVENTTEIVKDPKSHKDVEQAAYTLLVIDKDNGGNYLSRKIVFSRTDLLPHEQSIYNRQGQLVTFARYENFSDYSGTMFPGIVSIQRPIEGYGITISMVKLDVNVPLTDEQFVVTQPPGSQLINLDTKSSAAIQDEENKKPR